MRKNRRFIKITAAVLPVILTAGAVCTPLQAKAPKVEIDESMYVNMDYYGEIDDISVVKGCFLNGNTVIEDYGNYEEIINMSDRTEPVVEDGKVTWNLDNVEKQYFYYECKSEELKTRVPWDIDVSYKLNGVEARGEDLGGAVRFAGRPGPGHGGGAHCHRRYRRHHRQVSDRVVCRPPEPAPH